MMHSPSTGRFATASTALMVAGLALPASAAIVQIDSVSPTNVYGTGGYVQRTGNWNSSFSGTGTATTTEPVYNDISVSATLGRTGSSGSSSLVYSFNLTSQANWVSQQALAWATMQLTFDQSTTATLNVTTLNSRSGDQFRYAEKTGSAPTGANVLDWNWFSATGQFSNTFAAGTYTFFIEFYNNGGGPQGATALAGTWSFQQAGGGVPLPGAAGLAAIGLVGSARRRRR